MAQKFSKLTRTAVRNLEPGKSITEHGITFERLGNGDGRYSVGIMVDGQRIHRVLGTESAGVTRTNAEEFIEKARRDAREDRLSLPKGRKIALGFAAAAEKYLTRLEESGGKDIKAKRRRLSQHLIPFFRDMPLAKVSSFDVERYKKQRCAEFVRENTPAVPERKSRLVSKATINRELAVLSHLFRQAQEWGWIPAVSARIRRYQENQGRIVYLTTEQCRHLLECAKEDQNEQIYPFIRIGLDTSMRKMEILSIRREHIDLQRRIIHIPVAKAGSREQPITQSLADYLRDLLPTLPPGTPWLFPSLGSKSGHTVEIRKPFRRVVADAGLDPDQVVRHTMRHTAITHAVQAGIDLPTVKRFSGHKTLAMVEKYAHVNGPHIAEAMAKLDNRMQLAGHPGNK